MIFLTGYLRSGTTFIQKYLNCSGIKIDYQRLQHQLIEIKRQFQKKYDIENNSYEFNDLIGENWYDPNLFLDFLNDYFSKKGIYERNLGENLRMELSAHTPSSDSHINVAQNPKGYGTKEVFAEEFIPFFLSCQCLCVITIRNPIAVVNSIRADVPAKYVRSDISLLHIIRSWRKSVAFIIQHLSYPTFRWVRFEDFLADPAGRAREVLYGTKFEALFKACQGQLIDEDGTPWNGNSSFGSPENQRLVIEKDVVDIITFLCQREMIWANYIPRDMPVITESRAIKIMISLGFRGSDIETELRRRSCLEDRKDTIIKDNVMSDFIFMNVFSTMQSIGNAEASE